MDNNNGLALRSLDDVERLAKIACTSGLVSLRPEQAAVILLTGHELGLSPMQSLRGIYVVNGKPVLSADMLVAVVRASGRCASWVVVESTEDRCTITTQRKGESATASRTWTMADAKRAGVTGKPIWSQYPRTMLRHRCAADLAREVYPDVVLGLYDPEELGADNRVAIEAEPVVVAPPVTARLDAATLNAMGVEQREPSADVPAMLREFYARIDDIELPGESVAVWLKYKPEMLVVPAPDREAAWRALCKRTDQVGKMRNAGVWLKKAIADEEARRNINSQSVPDTLTLSVNEDAEPTAFELASSRLAQSRDLAELKAAWTHVRKVMWPTLGPAEQGALEHQKESLKVTLGQPTPPDGDPPKPRRTRRPTAPVDATSAPQEAASTPDAGPAAWAPVTLSDGRVVRSAEDARALLRTYPEPRLHASAKAHGGEWAALCDAELLARAAMARRAA